MSLCLCLCVYVFKSPAPFLACVLPHSKAGITALEFSLPKLLNLDLSLSIYPEEICKRIQNSDTFLLDQVDVVPD